MLAGARFTLVRALLPKRQGHGAAFPTSAKGTCSVMSTWPRTGQAGGLSTSEMQSASQVANKVLWGVVRVGCRFVASEPKSEAG